MALTGLIFKPPGENVHQKLDHTVRGAENLIEQDESDHDRLLVVEAEGLVQAAVVDEDAE